jgi:hypothetical protein
MGRLIESTARSRVKGWRGWDCSAERYEKGSDGPEGGAELLTCMRDREGTIGV